MILRDMTCGDIENLASLYRSGELDPTTRAAFNSHLARCSGCAERLVEQAELDTQLIRALSRETPDTRRLEKSVRTAIAAQNHARRRIRWTLPAAAAILLALSIPVPPRIYADAARDHQAEVIDREARRWRSDRDAIDLLAARHGVSSAQLLSVGRAGYRLERAKTCRIDGQPVLHLVYTDGQREYSLYLLHGVSQPATAVSVSGVGNLRLATFRKGNLTAVVVAKATRDCLQMARKAAAVL